MGMTGILRRLKGLQVTLTKWSRLGPSSIPVSRKRFLNLKPLAPQEKHTASKHGPNSWILASGFRHSDFSVFLQSPKMGGFRVQSWSPICFFWMVQRTARVSGSSLETYAREPLNLKTTQTS